MERSFELFHTDHIDLMQVHNLVDWRVHLATLRGWKREGKVRYLGVTHYTSSAYAELEAVLRSERLDFVQVNYSADDRAAEARILPLAAERGIAVLINLPFGGGGLLRRLQSRPLPDWASEIGCGSWSQVLLKYVLGHSAVTCVIPGTSNPAHMRGECRRGCGPPSRCRPAGKDRGGGRRLYGAQKAACEAAVADGFGGRAFIVRPGLIVGPGDPTGRFSHWPWRALGGGEMLVPDVPASEPLQCIDVRDLAAWTVLALEAGATGIHNATGPVGEAPMTWPALVSACVAEAGRRGVAAVPVPVGEAFLLAQGVAPWSDLPLWLPSTDAAYVAHSRVAVERAAAAGLTTRPLADTLADVMDEGVPPEGDPRCKALSRAREAAVIAQWRASRPGRGTGASPMATSPSSSSPSSSSS